MINKLIFLTAAVILAIIGLSACTPATALPANTPPPVRPELPSATPPQGLVTPEPVLPNATPEPAAPRLLTICLGQEPRSLFVYADRTEAATSVREALYDGPFDVYDFEVHPTILQEMPSIENGAIWLDSAEVKPGDLIVDANRNYSILQEGVVYRPSGCSSQACAQTYRGSEAVRIDQVKVRFRIQPGITWADGAPLTAADSVYSFQAARSLFPAFRPDLINATAAYQAADETTVDWWGLPGYATARPYTHFFTPLPEHAWRHIPFEELAAHESASRYPLGWGPYVIEEWTAGDHITLSKNPSYFRAGEGLPAFDQLVFRFAGGGQEALQALAVGECDLLDPSTNIEPLDPQLAELQRSGTAAIFAASGGAWEHLLFGIEPAEDQRPSFFRTAEMRRAAALCIDREGLVNALYQGMSQVPNTYLSPGHPLYLADAQTYPFDPQQAQALLDANGWIDQDGSAATPRISQGAAGFLPGTPLEITYLTTGELRRQRAAEFIQDSLQQCGFGTRIVTISLQELLAAGPEGPVFGRQFDLAQFGWNAALEPPCSLYLSSETPGPYPAFPKGWGGANAAGFSSPAFDAACQETLTALEGSEAYTNGHKTAQKIFAEQIPSLPLYLHVEVSAARADLCGYSPDPSASSPIWNLEELDYGESCPAQP